MFPSQFANIFLTYQTLVTNLHVPRVELSCKLREKMHRVTEPLNSGVASVDNWRGEYSYICAHRP